MAASSPICDFGWKAPAFTLPGTDGKSWSLDDVRGPKGTLIVFICNHCPYVLGAIDRLVLDVRALQEMGIGIAAICSNDATTHPQDSFENMKKLAQVHDFPFPYLHDESQQVARSWKAHCTPDFFGFDAGLGLQYRGRLDDAGRGPAGPARRRELVDAMRAVAERGRGPADQTPSIGCSIKWKAA